MANITPRKDKDGNITSYQIRVFRGRDASGKRLKDYMMTWRPAPGMTPKQIEKELNRQATLFEEACKNGVVSVEKPTFAAYAVYVTEMKKAEGVKAKSIAMYDALLPRINAEIGHLKLQDIRTEHLNRFYKKLGEPGQRKDGQRARAIIDVRAWLKENKSSQAKLAKAAGVGHATVEAVVNGRNVMEPTAQKIASAMGMPFKRCFEIIPGTSTLSPKTIIEHHRCISAILEYAADELLIPFNPAKRAKPPKLPKSEAESLEIEQVQAILEALNTEPLKWQVCIHLLIATGARRGEVMGLQWKHIDWKNNRLNLSENRIYTKQSGSISNSLKTGESRSVTVSDSVMELLKQWRSEQASAFMKLGITPSGYIMTNSEGKPMHPDAPSTWLVRFCKRHGLPQIHPHLFRHTQASLLIAEGVDILTVSKRLGHSKVSTTLDTYSHLLAKSDEQASNTLDKILYKKQA